MNEFFKSVHLSSQMFDPRLLASATEKVPSDGGFLVPSEYSRQILDQALEDQVVMPRAMVWPMASDTRKVPAIDDTDHSGGSLFGGGGTGVTASWADELGALADQKVKVRLIELHANKMGMISQCSSELIEDSDFDTILGNKLQAGAAWHLDDAFLNGNGAGKPLGIMSSACLVTVSKESSQPTDEVVYENITKMYAAMAPGCRRRATWVFNDGLIPSLYKMQNRVTNLAGNEVVGGSAVSVFNVDAQGNATLLTRPVIFSEHLATPGDLGDAMFCDFSQYMIGIRRQVTVERSAHAGFATDSVYYRLTVRVDGQPTWRKALTPEHGPTAQSPFVTLQAR